MMLTTSRKKTLSSRFVALVTAIGVVAGMGAIAWPAPARANTAPHLYALLDFERDGLSGVRQAVDASDWGSAATQLAAYYDQRVEPRGTGIPADENAVDAATRIAAGQFTFPGYQVVEMISPQTGEIDVDWDLDWSTHWATDEAPAGNAAALMYRFIDFGTLAAAYQALPEGDSRRVEFARAWITLATDFITDKGDDAITNSPPNNRLTEAIRLTQWLNSFDVFRHEPTVPDDLLAPYLEQIHVMATELAANVDQNHGNNWFISISRALYVCSIYFPEFTDAGLWRTKAVAAATRYIDRNMRSDGLTTEPTVNYQNYALDLLAQIQEYGAANGDEPFTTAQLEFLGLQAEAIAATIMPDGSIPLWGDSQNRFVDLRSVETFARALGRQDLLWVATGGEEGTRPEWASRSFPLSYSVMRSGWEAGDDYLFIDNHDTSYNASHRHPDDLSVIAYAHGRPLLVDPGVFEYSETGSAAWLRRTTEAHNTVEVGGQSQPKTTLAKPSRRVTDDWRSNAGFTLYQGFHEDYQPITHRRSVIRLGSGLWVVSDLLEGSPGEESYRQLWHPPADASVAVDAASGTAALGFDGLPGVVVAPVDSDVTTTVTHSDGYVASGDGVLHSDVEYVSIDQSTDGPAVFDTVLVAGEAGGAPEVEAYRIDLDVAPSVATSFGFVLEDRHGQLYLSRETTAGSRAFGDYSTDARFAYVESTSTGDPVGWSLAEGRNLHTDGHVLVSSDATISDLSARREGDALQLSMSQAPTMPISIHAPGVNQVTVNSTPVAFTREGDAVVLTPLSPEFDQSLWTNEASVLVGGNSHTWDFSADSGSAWESTSGTWSSDGTLANVGPDPRAISLTGPALTDATITATVQRDTAARATFGFGFIMRYIDDQNYYLARLYRVDKNPRAQVFAVVGGQGELLADEPITFDFAQSARLSASVSDSIIELAVDGDAVAKTSDDRLTSGRVGVAAEHVTVDFDDVAIDAGARWTFQPTDDAPWIPVRGEWGVTDPGDGDFVLAPSSSQNTAMAALPGLETDVRTHVSVDLRSVGSSYHGAGVASRCQDVSTYYLGRIYITPSGSRAELLRMLQGKRTDLAVVNLPAGFDLAGVRELEITTSGDLITFAIDGEEVARAIDGEIPSGGTCVQAHNADVAFDDVTVTELVDPVRWATSRGLADESTGPIRLLSDSVEDAQVSIAATPQWESMKVAATVQSDGWGSGGSAGLVVRASKDLLGYRVALHDDGMSQEVVVERIASGSYATQNPTAIGTADVDFDRDQPVELTVTARGTELAVDVNGQPALTASDSVIARGGLTLTASGLDVTFRDVHVTTSTGPWFDEPVATAPAAPAAVEAVAAETAIRLTWDVPWDGGSPLTGYVIYQEGVEDPVREVGGDTTTVDIEGIAPGVPTRFTVVAVNALGKSERSVWSDAEILPDGADAAPGSAVLSSTSGWTHGLDDGFFTVRMNLWWGQTASLFRLYENGVLIAELPLQVAGKAAQSASVDLAERRNGKYTYTGELVNSKGTTSTSSVEVEVTDAEPAQPVLSVSTRQADGSYDVVANLWWGTNATEYRFFENGQLVDSGTLEAATPGAQRATLAVAPPKAAGDHEYIVEFENHAGVATSAPLTVHLE